MTLNQSFLAFLEFYLRVEVEGRLSDETIFFLPHLCEIARCLT